MKESKEKRQHLDGDYPSLAAVSWGIGYAEQLLAIISEPLLIACAVVSFIDFSTHGGLLSIPAIMYAWAGAQGVAIDASMIMTGRRSFKALSLHYYGRGVALALLTIVLGVVAWATTDVQSLEQSLNLNADGALAQIFLSPQMVIHLRSAVAIGMMVVVAVSNHTSVTTAQAPARRIKMFDQLLNKVAPLVEQSASPAHGEQSIEQSNAPSGEQVSMEHMEHGALAPSTEQGEQVSMEQSIPAQSEHRALSMIEQRMYAAIMNNTHEADALLKLSQTMSTDEFTAMLKQRYPNYASYITVQRVSSVLAYARAQIEQCSAPSTEHPIEQNTDPLEQRSIAQSIEQVSMEQVPPAQSEQIIERSIEQVSMEHGAPPAQSEQRTEQSMKQVSMEHGAPHAQRRARSMKQSTEHLSTEHGAPAQLRAVIDPRERVRRAMQLNPHASDRELARIAKLGSGNTAKRHREAIERERVS